MSKYVDKSMERRKMTRKLVGVILVLSIILMMPAFAETTYYGTMMVDNCEEWVSLRDGPGTGCGRLAKVPLYAIVTDCEKSEWTGDFIYCNYDGQWGYILAQYLVPWADPEPEDGFILDVTMNGYRVVAQHAYADGGENLLVTCENEPGNPIWSYSTATDDVTELELITAFIGGAAQDPMVMVYNAEEGLTALDFVTGEVRWQLTGEHLGESISQETDGEGNTYIGGYYGPDPVCIDVYGNVKWRADSEGCYWLYNIELVEGELICTYDVMDGDPEKQGRVLFGLDGKMIRKEYE